jgi:AcrR family transcriptional regulator
MPKAKPTEEKCAPKWRRCPEDRPEQIIKAALEVFGERGLANARLQDIAERAGVSKGTIYLYFPNKEELFREMIRQTAVAALERAEKAVTHGTPIEQLLAFMKGYWQFVRSPAFSSIYRLVLGELHQFPDLATFYAHDVSARRLNIISGIIRRGIDSGDFREIDPMVAARMLSAIVVQHGIWRDKDTGVPLLAHRTDDEVFRELAAFYLYSITATGGAFAQADGAPQDALSLISFDND